MEYFSFLDFGKMPEAKMPAAMQSVLVLSSAWRGDYQGGRDYSNDFKNVNKFATCSSVKPFINFAGINDVS